MNERTDKFPRVIKRTLTVTTAETWVITIQWGDGEAQPQDNGQPQGVSTVQREDLLTRGKNDEAI